jgi:hypothetical protein
VLPDGTKLRDATAAQCLNVGEWLTVVGRIAKIGAVRKPASALYERRRKSQNTRFGSTVVTDALELELKAIKTLLEVLEPLAPNVRESVIDYVFKRMGLTAPPKSGFLKPDIVEEPPLALRVADGPVTKDIRSLKQDKSPGSVSEMVALVAYYLLHLAPGEERRNYITQEDIGKYFVQAGFPIPGSSPMALVHAKNAGYLDGLDRGRYRLNSVGHNLIAHKLPKSTEGPAVRTRRQARPAKKAAKARRTKK